MRLLAVSCTAALMITLFAPAASGGGLLVLKDGSSIAVDEMTVRGGRVDVRLPGSNQAVAYAVDDVDLEASGLAPEAVATTFTTETKAVRGGFDAAIAPPPGDGESVIVTDQDVEHVRPQRGEAGDEEEEDEAPPARTTSLLVSNLQREVSANGVLTVTGTVTNNGDVEVNAIAITGDARDSGGASLGRGTTGIASALKPGEAAEFSINFPVTGTVANIKVTAVAAISEFEFEPVPAPQENDDEGFYENDEEPDDTVGDDFAEEDEFSEELEE